MPDRPHRLSLCWLRRDLRPHDHKALSLASDQSEKVIPVFVYDTEILDFLPTRHDRRLWFIHQSIEELVEAFGGCLITAHGDPTELIPKLAKELGADAVFAAHDDDPYGVRRDKAVEETLKSKDIEFKTVCDHVIFEKRQVLSQAGEPMKVFTPYSRAWLGRLRPSDLAPHHPDLTRLASERKPLENGKWGNHTLLEIGFYPTSLWLEPGAKAGQERLGQFLARVDRYGQDRNIPSIEGTSGLSVHLRFGTVSIRECLRAVNGSSSEGALKWQSELIWREFYHMILACFPHVGEGKTFKHELNDLEWPGEEQHLEAWKRGETGFPIVDAAMRCFNQTGWMHNRLRMVVAMFLTKDLLIDWRQGEQYFADGLLDFELASNNGGWQWSASTGVDAQPYFRVFNPVLQSQKFDPEGRFIRDWVPELRGVSNSEIHWPHDGLFAPDGYPEPIVDHRKQKELAIALFKKS
ncbi:MAG: DNA photolyase family protein [Fimbriimonadaceae bacterium]|jgi:deoxyribodipyrimidine photo-lyase|nr:DNA photolyase family protein [Fimbriimonadaceae bacterium]